MIVKRDGGCLDERFTTDERCTPARRPGIDS